MRPIEMMIGRCAARVAACCLACLFAVSLTVSVAACDEDTAASTTLANGTRKSSQPVAFTTEDGVTLRGHVFGSGSAGVVLAHMYPADQTSWYTTAERLAQEGYLVLTFDFRGYGESDGDKDIDQLDKDVSAAVGALNVAGAGHIVLVGASMGGTASLIAAEPWQWLSRLQLAGVVTLSAPVEFKGLSAEQAVPKLQIPLRFIAAEGDAGAAGARRLQELSGGKGDLRIVPGDDHGTELLEGEAADQVWDLLVGFLDDHLDPTHL